MKLSGYGVFGEKIFRWTLPRVCPWWFFYSDLTALWPYDILVFTIYSIQPTILQAFEHTTALWKWHIQFPCSFKRNGNCSHRWGKCFAFYRVTGIPHRTLLYLPCWLLCTRKCAMILPVCWAFHHSQCYCDDDMRRTWYYCGRKSPPSVIRWWHYSTGVWCSNLPLPFSLLETTYSSSDHRSVFGDWLVVVTPILMTSFYIAFHSVNCWWLLTRWFSTCVLVT